MKKEGNTQTTHRIEGPVWPEDGTFSSTSYLCSELVPTASGTDRVDYHCFPAGYGGQVSGIDAAARVQSTGMFHVLSLIGPPQGPWNYRDEDFSCLMKPKGLSQRALLHAVGHGKVGRIDNAPPLILDALRAIGLDAHCTRIGALCSQDRFDINGWQFRWNGSSFQGRHPMVPGQASIHTSANRQPLSMQREGFARRDGCEAERFELDLLEPSPRHRTKGRSGARHVLLAAALLGAGL